MSFRSTVKFPSCVLLPAIDWLVDLGPATPVRCQEIGARHEHSRGSDMVISTPYANNALCPDRT